MITIHEMFQVIILVFKPYRMNSPLQVLYVLFVTAAHD